MERTGPTFQVEVPEEMHLTPTLPTMRPGYPAVVCVSVPRRGGSDRPYQWFVTDYRSKLLTAYAVTSLLDPLAGSALPAVPTTSPPFDPTRLGAAGLELSWLQEAFFAGQPLTEEGRASARGTVAFLVAATALPWLMTYCVDFFTWIGWPSSTAPRIA